MGAGAHRAPHPGTWIWSPRSGRGLQASHPLPHPPPRPRRQLLRALPALPRAPPRWAPFWQRSRGPHWPRPAQEGALGCPPPTAVLTGKAALGPLQAQGPSPTSGRQREASSWGQRGDRVHGGRGGEWPGDPAHPPPATALRSTLTAAAATSLASLVGQGTLEAEQCFQPFGREHMAGHVQRRPWTFSRGAGCHGDREPGAMATAG